LTSAFDNSSPQFRKNSRVAGKIRRTSRKNSKKTYFSHLRNEKLDPFSWLAPCFVAIVTFLVFAPVMENDFVTWDDYDNLVSNPSYRGLGWNQVGWMFTTFHLGHYQPLSWLTFALDYVLWGMDPRGYHLTNLIFHAANAVFFYFIARRLIALALSNPEQEKSWHLTATAAFAALLFAIHPLRVESVAWATERRDVLSGFFYLWTLYCYLRATSTSGLISRRHWLAAAVGVYVLSLLSKGTAMTLPAILILLDIFPLRRLQGRIRDWFKPQNRRLWVEKLPFVALACAFAVIALIAQHSTGALTVFRQYDMNFRFAQAFYGLMFYLWKTMLPAHLSPLYELPSDLAPWVWIFLVSAADVITISLAAFFLRRRWPALLACWLYYVVLLTPVLGFAQSGPQLVADRYSYLACLSWALLAAGGLLWIWSPSSASGGDHQRRFLTPSVIGIGILSILGFLTWEQIGVWRDTRTLWEYVIAVMPDSSVGHYNLAKTLETQGKPDQALELYRRAVILRPDNADAHYNLARLLAGQGQQEAAIRHYRQASAIKPDDADIHNNLGLLLAARGEVEASLAELQKAVKIDPNHARAYFNMGKVFARQGDFDKAAAAYQKALTLDPTEVEIRLGLGSVLARQGNLEAAIMQYQQAVKLKPDSADAHLALAKLLVAQGKKNEADRHYEIALQIINSQNQTQPAR
jgi:protein O-mannosyl-transferase